MLLYHHPAFHDHDPGFAHPERAARLDAVVAALRTAGVWDRAGHPDCPRVRDADLLRAHEPILLANVRQACAAASRVGHSALDPDTAVSAGSLDAAERSAGAAVDAAARVLAGEDDRALCLVRPPGHHATRARSMGFCLFNHVAVAAAWAVAEGGASRVAVVDFDVHHGNGTQDIFWRRGDVFYLSLHRFPFYPGTGAGSERGADGGLDTTLNLPLLAGSTPGQFLAALDVGLGAVRAFAPDLLLVSAGFDGWEGDPIGGLGLPASTYREATRRIVDVATDVARGRVVSVLEGGYHPAGLAACVVEHALALDGRDRVPAGGGGRSGRREASPAS